jgi:hypothetical protein
VRLPLSMQPHPAGVTNRVANRTEGHMRAASKDRGPFDSLVHMTISFGFQTMRQTIATLGSVSALLTALLTAPALLLAYLG